METIIQQMLQMQKENQLREDKLRSEIQEIQKEHQKEIQKMQKEHQKIQKEQKKEHQKDIQKLQIENQLREDNLRLEMKKEKQKLEENLRQEINDTKKVYQNYTFSSDSASSSRSGSFSTISDNEIDDILKKIGFKVEQKTDLDLILPKDSKFANMEAKFKTFNWNECENSENTD